MENITQRKSNLITFRLLKNYFLDLSRGREIRGLRERKWSGLPRLLFYVAPPYFWKATLKARA